MTARACRECGKPLPAWNRHARCERCRKSVPCPTCGQSMHRTSTRCIHCQQADQCGENNPNWKGGKTYNWYETYIKPYRRGNPEKLAAHRAVWTAVKAGTLRKPRACQRCGTDWGRIEAHHDDYSKPLEVVWLCPACHHVADAERREREQVVERVTVACQHDTQAQVEL